MANNEASKKLLKPFPTSAIKPHPNNPKLSYVEGHTYIHKIIDATDNTWDWKIIRQDFHPYGATGKGNARLLITVIGELTIPGLGTRAGMGVQVVTADTGGEDMWKGAITDAIKGAAKLFGVGLELYGPDYGAGEIESPRYPDSVNAAQTRSQAPRRDEPRTPASSGQRTEQGLTPRQREFIFAIARELGLSVEQIEAESSQSFSKSIGNLNRRDASIFIERLQQRRQERTAAPQRDNPMSVPPDPIEPDDVADDNMSSQSMLDQFDRNQKAASYRS